VPLGNGHAFARWAKLVEDGVEPVEAMRREFQGFSARYQRPSRACACDESQCESPCCIFFSGGGWLLTTAGQWGTKGGRRRRWHASVCRKRRRCYALGLGGKRGSHPHRHPRLQGAGSASWTHQRKRHGQTSRTGGCRSEVRKGIRSREFERPTPADEPRLSACPTGRHALARSQAVSVSAVKRGALNPPHGQGPRGRR
jgi:hypothetical protein